jgi:hypothetical protein
LAQSKSLHPYHNLNNEESKHTKNLTPNSPPTNVGTNPKELHTPTSFAKKSKGHAMDIKRENETLKGCFC